ncbi:MAG: hypothetical protein WC472_04470 [Candidatus Paceibacterota bacterium]
MDFKEYFKTKSLLKTPNIGVHYEQKITPDLIWCVSHVVLNLIGNDQSRVFTDKDIRESLVFNSLMRDYFSKAPQENAENEYNKVSSYQLGILAFAGILDQVAERPKKYQVNNAEVLKFIAVNDFNASSFLCEYTEKFISDNGLSEVFENYRQNPNQDNYLKAKEAYWNWAKTHTAVKGDDRRHTYRVFNKLFNIFCYKNRLPGEDASNITSGPCPYSFLIYNRTNFRDKDMPSGMTRQQYQEEVLSEIEQDGVVETLLQKVKDLVKIRHGNDSEIRDHSFNYVTNSGVHVHHILPRHSYPQYSLSKENLISLTPGQHLSLAHVEANTRTINSEFQKVCLKKKFEHIKTSVESNDGFYDLKEFIKILNTCFNWTLSENSDLQIIESNLLSI